MNYELVIFDWDGTLMDSTRVIATSLQLACADIGIAVPAERDARFGTEESYRDAGMSGER